LVPQTCPGLVKGAFAVSRALLVFQDTLPEGHLAFNTVDDHQQIDSVRWKSQLVAASDTLERAQQAPTA
jgi:hypothetical protein